MAAIGEVLAQHAKDRFPVLFTRRGVGFFHGGLESISRLIGEAGKYNPANGRSDGLEIKVDDALEISEQTEI